MIQFLPAFALLAFATPGADTTIEVGKADWDSLPTLARVDRRLPYEQMAGAVEDMLASEQCTLKGQSPRRFDITVPYAVLLGPDRRASRVVVADIGCAPLETLVGNLVADMSEIGDFQPTPVTRPKWYSSRLNFTQE